MKEDFLTAVSDNFQVFKYFVKKLNKTSKYAEL